ncbi:hypothetical protein [Nocardia implantans]|uniref:Uncharacterized protein n=1 Tax=Nocardia implantans TaxID=3108168 RepID=A0ABU6AMX3_9NOCA|nr:MULTISPECIES: hypothetical protein [unclassified Nocardia]MBF6191966.1 hypothetical protein [Nocardia beijingensis]MEA3530096.1 hypothetical protein [Nocardia sp. CDC192]MEB3508804.1 hypothetical protein [Nocardia sp. CDC186]
MTAHRPAQVARHAAVVLAGAASLSLTVAAGAYIVHQIADTQRPDTPIAAPVTPAAPDEPRHGHGRDFDPVLTGNSFVLSATVSESHVAEPEQVEQQAASLTTPPARTPVGGTVRIGDAYVGARVAEGEADTVSVTVDTNALTMLTGLLHSDSRPEPNAGNVTTMRTDLDTQRGEVRVAFSDPSLGEHGVQLDRHPAPKGTDERAPARGAADSTVV